MEKEADKNGGTAAVCWCATQTNRCPHNVASKIPGCWEEIEQTIDGVLRQFDRKTIRKFLKRDVDGNQKRSGYLDQAQQKAVYSQDLQKLVSQAAHKTAIREGLGPPPTANPSASSPNSRAQTPSGVGGGRGGGGAQANDPHSSSAIAAQSLFSSASRPSTAPDGSMKKKQQIVNPALGLGPLKPAVGFFQNAVEVDSDGFAKTVPLPEKNKSNKSVTLPSLHPGSEERSEGPGSPVPLFVLRGPESDAWGVDKTGKKNNNATSTTDEEADLPPNVISSGNTPLLPLSSTPGPYSGIPGDTAVAAGLMRVADVVSRKILPWQAMQCPRALETLRDVRLAWILSKHEEFILRMTRQLEDKVYSFIEKKEEEVDVWMDKEVTTWQQAMTSEEANQALFFRREKERIQRRMQQQEIASRKREIAMACALDDKERDATREQLVNFRRLCRTDTTKIDVRVLHASMDSAQSKAMAQQSISNREIFRRVEDAHEWLCCLADNAVTASESEVQIKNLFDQLDRERDRSLTSLHTALTTYTDQHNAIVEAITIFQGKIHEHAADFLRREQLVSRAFLQYTLAIITGEIKPHTTDLRRSSVAWEAKFAADRAYKKDQAMLKDYNMSLAPFNKLVDSLKERMHVQLEHLTTKMQSVLNGRDNDISRRKAGIHKRFSKHVSKSCNNRRMRLKNSSSSRKEEYDLEGRGVTSLGDLSSELRTAIDQLWVKQHLRERRMYEAAEGRMERLEKSALIIWNKHSHIAIHVNKEKYDDWLAQYRRDRDIVTTTRLQEIITFFTNWWQLFSGELRSFADNVKPIVADLCKRACEYDVSVTVDQNIQDLTRDTELTYAMLTGSIRRLRSIVSDYYEQESIHSDESIKERRGAMLADWQENLSRLNDQINKRIGTLKDMECDLEETIRLTLVQHEAEAIVFEQQTCAKMEEFWLEWRKRFEDQGKELRETQRDHEIAQSSGKSKSKKTAKDAQLDELVNTTNSPESKSKLKSEVSGVVVGDEDNKPADESGDADADAESSSPPSSIPDTTRAKMVLDSILMEAYKELMHKIVRSVEVVKKEYGVGRKRHIPAYMVTKILFKAMDWFWDRAKLAEKCPGALSRKGHILFKDGIPTLARSTFCVGSSLAILSTLTLKENYYMDFEDVMEVIEGKGIKRCLIVGLLLMCQQFGSFGTRLMMSEALWVASCAGVSPPRRTVG